MGRIRRRVAKLGAGWNPTLEWYALAVEALLQRPVANPTSWTYLAAIHGMDPGGWVSNGVISPSAPLPSPAQRATMWDQCQHGGWFFVPWHRGYLAAFEAVVAQTVADLGGPDAAELVAGGAGGRHHRVGGEMPVAADIVSSDLDDSRAYASHRGLYGVARHARAGQDDVTP